ncbi:MAG: hypothetical protein JXR48_17810 [Candidatus Delongbacteria bacterium]|nr:hypothetical protein [Candidatus Delongbacteria bacterium]MBN2836815.1 hypothetical protein [Candidatus Delongbacteria bacterium]
MKGQFEKKVNMIIPIWKKTKHISVSLSELYPIVIVNNNIFEIYDFNFNLSKYEYIKSVDSNMQLPSRGLRAAMPLEFYGGKCCAVINIDCFDDIENQILLLHEFVHCYQYKTCEPTLRKNLELQKVSTEKGDMMWEINYEFPYNNTDVTFYLKQYFSNLDNLESFSELHLNIKNCVSALDYEYMIWQEWKEGYARYIENCIRNYLNVNQNTLSNFDNFDRTVFYELGCRWFNLHNDIDLVENYKALLLL